MEYAVRNGFHPENAARQGREAADALLRALTPTPAPVEPPAGKYVPAVGDIVIGLFHDDALARVDSTEPLRWSSWGNGRWHSDCEFGLTHDARLATDAEKRAAGLAVPPPATAGEDRSRGCVVAFCADHAEVEVVTGPFCPVCSMGKVLDDGVRLGRTAKWPTTPAPEAKCEMCGGPHVRDVFHAADLQPPAPEAKRPTVDRAYDRVVAVRDYLDLLVSIQPETRRITAALAASIGYVLPAPCPPPVAGRGEDDMRSAAQALLDALGDILLVQPESSPIRDKVRALRASIARTVRS